MSSQNLSKHAKKVAKTRQRFARIIAGTPIAHAPVRSEEHSFESLESQSREVQGHSQGIKFYNIIFLILYL